MLKNSIRPQVEALEDRQLLSVSPLTTSSLFDGSTTIRHLKHELNVELSTLPGMTKPDVTKLDKLFVNFVYRIDLPEGNLGFDDMAPSSMKRLSVAVNDWLAEVQSLDATTAHDSMSHLLHGLSNSEMSVSAPAYANDQAISDTVAQTTNLPNTKDQPINPVVEYFIDSELVSHWQVFTTNTETWNIP
jgi:hypothetical protein